MGELLHRVAEKTEARADRAKSPLRDEQEVGKKLYEMPFNIFMLDLRGQRLMRLSHTSHLMSSSHACVSFEWKSLKWAIARTKAWITMVYPNIDPSGFDNFMKESHFSED
ncbi:hypothetical protein Fot_33380 [Forsythia ovata]|uniref:Uncharacterized protein n=1 Tax=Forsythia ovata TaxID=205694 RepID=A0ABD1TB00_9LAMI